jgi:hypothetical protein|tara:strand:- start:721 stop:975 length:255 start_codon:yes stop_codon:yes gene_type:complete
LITKDLKKQIYANNLPLVSKKEQKFQRQENQLLHEMDELEFEICRNLMTIVESRWNAPILMQETEKKLKQWHFVWVELDELHGM